MSLARLARAQVTATGVAALLSIVLSTVLLFLTFGGLVPAQEEARREVARVTKIEAVLADQTLEQGRYLITLERSWLADRDTHRREVVALFASALNVENEDDERATLERLRDDFAVLNRLQDRAAAAAIDAPEVADRLRTEREIPVYVAMQESAEALVDLVEARADARLSRDGLLLALLAGFFAIVSITLVAVTGVRARRTAAALVGRLEGLQVALGAVVHGDRRATRAPESPDEIGRLGQRFNEMLDRLDDLDRMRLEFVSSVTHELRTPLAAIRGYVELFELDLESPSAEQLDFLRIIARNARRLERQIEDLLLFSRLEQGEVTLARARVELGALVRRTAEELSVFAHEHEVTLDTGRSPEPVWVLGDGERLLQVVTNLIVNAIKYTPAGGRVTVSVRVTQNEAVLVVDDTGVGMAAEPLRRAFERFYRASDVRDDIPGAGLGLTIVRALVEQHGGTVSLVSDEGKGTRAEVRLPSPDRITVPPDEPARATRAGDR